MIYYVRHGQSTYNLKKIVTGRRDVPLTKKGVEQAQITAEQLKDIKFDVCYCSPLIRVKQTLNEILKYHKYLSINYDNRIIERDYGILTGRDKKDIDHLEDYKNRYIIGKKSSIEGLESPEALIKRASDFYDEIVKKHKDENILIVAHGGFGRATRVYFEGLPKDNDLINVPIKNAEVATFETNREKELQERSL